MSSEGNLISLGDPSAQQCETGTLIDFTMEETTPFNTALMTIAEVDDTFGLFDRKSNSVLSTETETTTTAINSGVTGINDAFINSTTTDFEADTNSMACDASATLTAAADSSVESDFLDIDNLSTFSISDSSDPHIRLSASNSKDVDSPGSPDSVQSYSEFASINALRKMLEKTPVQKLASRMETMAPVLSRRIFPSNPTNTMPMPPPENSFQHLSATLPRASVQPLKVTPPMTPESTVTGGTQPSYKRAANTSISSHKENDGQGKSCASALVYRKFAPPIAASSPKPQTTSVYPLGTPPKNRNYALGTPPRPRNYALGTPPRNRNYALGTPPRKSNIRSSGQQTMNTSKIHETSRISNPSPKLEVNPIPRYIPTPQYGNKTESTAIMDKKRLMSHGEDNSNKKRFLSGTLPRATVKPLKATLPMTGSTVVTGGTLPNYKRAANTSISMHNQNDGQGKSCVSAPVHRKFPPPIASSSPKPQTSSTSVYALGTPPRNRNIRSSGYGQHAMNTSRIQETSRISNTSPKLGEVIPRYIPTPQFGNKAESTATDKQRLMSLGEDNSNKYRDRIASVPQYSRETKENNIRQLRK